jgi:hypothetical protein
VVRVATVAKDVDGEEGARLSREPSTFAEFD